MVGIAANIAGFTQRWIESYALGIGHIPLSNLYESLVFFALAIAAVYLVVERRINSRAVGAVALPLAFLAMAYASLRPKSMIAFTACAGVEKQLADCPRDHLFHRIRCLYHRFRHQPDVPDQSGTRIHVAAVLTSRFPA